ncbi:MAG TPA: hypothetical protein VMZ28_25440, partial [Kofleriaceae bacterium]|nr:hypothetical protein [Kofleriaceae bacterium]
SQSSFAALLTGLAVLAAVRWRVRPVALAAGAVAAAGLTAAVWLRREAVPPAAERPAPPVEAAADTTPPLEADDDDGFGAFGAEDDHLTPDELADQLDDEDLAAIDRYIAQKGSP